LASNAGVFLLHLSGRFWHQLFRLYQMSCAAFRYLVEVIRDTPRPGPSQTEFQRLPVAAAVIALARFVQRRRGTTHGLKPEFAA
jgi:hypothetical protein